jgi:hypothetical protein
VLNGVGADNKISYQFVHQEYDLNNDGFGSLFITVPSKLVQEKAVFSLSGLNQNSRDWMMVFMYQKQLRFLVQATNLVLRKENKRQVNILVDNPYPNNTKLTVSFNKEQFSFLMKKGYNKFSIAACSPYITGVREISFLINGSEKLVQTIELKPISNYTFHLIHHSHNDIGYSHLQTEVEQIQNRNIVTAIHWIKTNENKLEKPIWHIESLWAVENFLKIASTIEKELFRKYVKSGNLVLSANYANILTGLCQAEELNWALEYANYLKKEYGFEINNVMTTDIPGLSYSAFLSYVNNNIPYLSFGPNYVGALADKGDRVGGVIKEQGDKAFYWKADSSSDKKLLVWTAGKGYSYFHGITNSEKQEAWEQRISDYCEELLNKQYPYEMVQLRYTKVSDNGPVDTSLLGFIENWNQQFSVPQLKLSSVNTLFSSFESKYGKELPVYSGEISPYWEDGAYSTAKEEMDNRLLVLKTLSLEKEINRRKDKDKFKAKLYLLHKNVVLFHEHTWGSWCSISDPEIPFTTEQWAIKKGFLDSAQFYYESISKELLFKESFKKQKSAPNLAIQDYEIDQIHGGLKSIVINQNELVSSNGEYGFFEPIYAKGINPMEIVRPKTYSVLTLVDNSTLKQQMVFCTLPSMDSIEILYTLNKKLAKLTCRFIFNKTLVKDKEAMHVAMPFKEKPQELKYGNNEHFLSYPESQLAGSNKEFICVEDRILVCHEKMTVSISSPAFALYEVGLPINENKLNGAKVWTRENQNRSNLFLYVFNNYWHTNYKAYQEGHFDFEITLIAQKK